MKFSEFVVESRAYRRKGWVNIKTGKMVLWAFRGRTIRPFHSEYVLNNVDKFFRGGEDRLLTTFANAFGFEPDEMEAQSLWNDLKSGKVDRDSNLDSIMNEAGWRRVVFDEGISSIEANSPQDARKVVDIVMKKIKWDDIQSLYIFDKGHLNDPTEIYNSDDMATYAKTGRIGKRTEIGRTMAMFRDHLELDEGVKNIVNKLRKIPSVVRKVQDTADMGVNQAALTLLTIPFVSNLLSSSDKQQQALTVMRTLRSVILGEDNIVESSNYRGEMLIGWASPSNKLHLYPEGGRMGKFHSQILTNLFAFKDFRKFMGGNIEKSIIDDMKHFVDDGTLTQDQLNITVSRSYESVYNALKSGKSDGHWETEENFQEAGWIKIRIDRRSNGNSLLAGSNKGCHAVAKILDKKLGGWGNLTGYRFYINSDPITDQDTWKTYIKTGRIPRRTNIGRTMSQFRESAGDRDLFRAHWKKAPLMQSGATDVKKRNAHWDAYFKHFEDKYGKIPARVKHAMRMADYKPNPSVTYKGKKFKLRTGMDELDLLYNVLSEEKRIPKTRKNQDPDTHSDLYTDEDPKGTIHGLGFKDVATAKASVAKIKGSDRTHAHKIQAAIAMEQRAKVMGKTAEAAVYRKFIEEMKKKTKEMREGWSDKYKRSIDCNNPKGFSQRAHCQGRKK